MGMRIIFGWKGSFEKGISDRMVDGSRNEMNSGVLYLVATPIGNLEDITYRAVRILQEVDLILAEDTRTSGKLLSHYGIKTPTTSYHEHNKFSKLPVLLSKLEEGKSLALISDAGTPGISDPGEELVAACVEKGIEVYAIPGAVAAICALTSSGISGRRFAFEAFLPKKKKKRQQVLHELKQETRTIVLYEAPHHLKALLEELMDALGDRNIVLCRELTKRYEEKTKTTFSEALQKYETVDPRGEYVVIIEGKTENDVENRDNRQWNDITIEEQMEIYMNRGLERGEAMKQVAKMRGLRKREVYEALLEAKET